MKKFRRNTRGKEMIIVLDFGGQYNQLIARRVRECHVYAEVHPYTISIDKIKEINPKGIIFTGDPTASMPGIRRDTAEKSLIWGFRFLGSATVHS